MQLTLVVTPLLHVYCVALQSRSRHHAVCVPICYAVTPYLPREVTFNQLCLACVREKGTLLLNISARVRLNASGYRGCYAGVMVELHLKKTLSSAFKYLGGADICGGISEAKGNDSDGLSWVLLQRQ